MIKTGDKVKIIDVHAGSSHFQTRLRYIGNIEIVGDLISRHILDGDFFDAIIGERYFFGVKLELVDD